MSALGQLNNYSIPKHLKRQKLTLNKPAQRNFENVKQARMRMS